MEVFTYTNDNGYKAEIVVSVSPSTCMRCKEKDVLTLYTDNEYNEYFSGEFCEECIKKLFAKARNQEIKKKENNDYGT